MVSATSALIQGRSAVIEPLVEIYAFQPDTTTSRLHHQLLIKAITQLIPLINSLHKMERVFKKKLIFHFPLHPTPTHLALQFVMRNIDSIVSAQ